MTGVSERQVLVGAGFDFTGPLASWGHNAKAGVDAALARANAEGGAHGRVIRLVTADHGYQVSRALEVTRHLVEDLQVLALMCHLGGPINHAVAPYLTARGVPSIFPCTVTSFSGPPFVSDLATGGDQTVLIVDELIARGFTRIATFYQDDAYGWDGRERGRARLHAVGLEYVAAVPFTIGETDFSAHAPALAASRAEVIVLQVDIRQPGPLARACHAIGYAPVLIGPSPLVTDETIARGGADLEGLMGVDITPGPMEPGTFLDQYRADLRRYAPQAPLDRTTIYGYQKGALFVEALRRAGRDLTRASLWEGIRSIQGWDPGWGLAYRYVGDHHPVMSQWGRFAIVSEGRWTPVGEAWGRRPGSEGLERARGVEGERHGRADDRDVVAAVELGQQ